MGKRKHDYSEEEIRRKIKKLTKKLANATNKDAEERTVVEKTPDSSPLDIPYGQSPYGESSYASPQAQYEEYDLYVPSLTAERPVSPQPDQPAQPISPVPPPSPSLPPPPPQTSSQPGPSVEKEATHEQQLGEEILKLLGDAPKNETPLGPSIHKDIAQRWQDILAKGLSKDTKESLLKDYLVPSNCDLLLAPTLNPEVKAALPDVLVKRDSSLSYKQKQLGIALSALASVTEMIISDETSKQKLLKPLSDACRILCDSHHTDTKIRRNFVISSINAKLKDALIESSRDKFLFGENISDKLKTAKAIQQSGDALKNAQKTRFQRSNNGPATANKGRLNYVPQHRKMDNKSHEAGRRAPNAAYRQPQSSQATQARRPAERSFPVKPQPAHRR